MTDSNGGWKAGLFGCFDSFVPNCLTSTFIPCQSLGATAVKLGWQDFNKVAGGLLLVFIITQILSYTVANVSALYGLSLFIVGFILRQKVRERDNLEGSPV